MRRMTMKVYDHDVLANVFCVAGTAYAAVAQAVAPAIPISAVEWEPTTIADIARACLGGLAGGLGFAWSAKMGDPLNVLVGVVLAVAWAGLLGPLILHAAAIYYPWLSGALNDPLFMLASGGLVAAGGMPLYLLVLAVFDTLKATLPKIIEAFINKKLGG